MESNSNTTEFSTENLLQLLDIIKNNINDGNLDIHTQERIWDSLLWDKNDPDNKEMIKYLFTGWWIYQNLQAKDPN